MTEPLPFSLFKARGQPGEWYGYVRIDGVTYKIAAHREGHGPAKHFVGTVKRHLKADQQSLPLPTAGRGHKAAEVSQPRESVRVPPGVVEGFDDDELPEEL